MVKSREQKITSILANNDRLSKLFSEFDVDFDEISQDLISTLINYDTLLQETTVYSLAENPEKVSGKTEITEITTRADVGGDLAGTYFTIDAPGTPYYVWYNTGSTTDPALGTRASIPVLYSPNDSASQIAALTSAVLDAELDFTASASGDTITFSTNIDGSILDAANGSGFLSPGFSFNVLQQGLDPSRSITALNEAVSTALGLFPASIGSPHENFYRSFLSSEGTAYTYFLKWIYYCYKYFNEEQFFFNNLLEHYIPAYDSSIISSTAQLKIYFDGLGIILDTLDQKIEDLYNLGDPDTIDERYLQHMAQLLGYQKEDFSIQNISFRELIKNLTEIYKTKGTRYSFQLFFRLLGFQADLREYYWDRDAQNPEGFASITEFDYLYYLTVQDPRKRTTTQTLNPNDSRPVQPIQTSQWTKVKDLRDFSALLGDYTLGEILGLKDSELEEEERFTYFKTNFINFQLTQFYNKQDLTAKDTDTILKYVRFLTPIYVSAFVEVVTTPWEDFFEMSNPLANEVGLDGDPGNPFWVDILLPFLFVTLRDYIPISIQPAPAGALVIANTATSDLLSDGFPDSAIDQIFGDPAHGIDITGSVVLNSPVDLTENQFLNLKIDKGRGPAVSIAASAAQTFDTLITQLNSRFATLGLDVTATRVGAAPSYDIRITSNTLGTSSKIYMIPGLSEDLFTALGNTLDTPVSGFSINKGHQEFGLSYATPTSPTGLVLGTTYDFNINVDDEDYTEVDVTLDNIASTSLSDVVNAINNHYTPIDSYTFSSSTTVEQQSQSVLSDGKILTAYRDASTNSGKVVIINSDGTLSRSGINFSLSDVRDIATAASNDQDVPRFIVTWYDILNDVAKWTVYDNDGSKITIDQIIEPTASGVQFIDAITLSNNNVAIFYTVTVPSNEAKVKIIDIDTLSTITTETWYNAAITSIKANTLGDKMVATGITGAGGQLVFLNEDGSFALADEPTSTKNFSPGQAIANIDLTETDSNYIVIAYRANKISSPEDYQGYFTIWDSAGNVIVGVTPFTNEDIYNVSVTKNSINNIIFAYDKRSNGNAYYKGYDQNGTFVKKETVLYSASSIDELDIIALASADIAVNIMAPLKGVYLRMSYIGTIADSSNDNRLILRSVLSGDTWDDTIENYAKATDDGHFFEIDGQPYVFDNYSTYYSALGVDFTEERNKFNTFFQNSPADDFVDLFQDTLSLVFTLLVAANEFPAERVEKAGFYIQRNGYINRNPNYVVGDRKKSYWMRHLDISEDLRSDPLRAGKEIDWPQWLRESSSYADWSSWTMAIDYFTASYDLPLYAPTGKMIFGGAVAQFGPYEVFYYGQPTGSTVYYDIQGLLAQGETATITFTIPGLSPYTFPIGADIAFINSSGIWETVPTTRSVSGKELTATVTHFSAWGILDSTVPESEISINVTGGQVGQIVQLTQNDYLQIDFGGNALYGPFDEFPYLPSGRATLTGTSAFSVGNEFTVIPVGGLTATGIATTAFTFTYRYTSTGQIRTKDASSEFDITMLYFATGSMTATGIAEILNIFDFEYTSTGSFTITGIAETTSEQDYTATGGLIASGETIREVDIIFEAIIDFPPPTLFGEPDYYKDISFVASGGFVIQGMLGSQTAVIGISLSADTGLLDSTSYYFIVNGAEYSITTGVGGTTLEQLATLIDATVSGDGFSSFAVGFTGNKHIRVENIANRGHESFVDLDFGQSGPDLWTNISSFQFLANPNADDGLPAEIDIITESTGGTIFLGSSGYQEVGL